MTKFKIDPATTALVAIDLQYGIVSLSTKPFESSEVVTRTRQIADALRKAGGTVVFVRVTNAPDNSDALKPLTDASSSAAPPSKPAQWSQLVADLGVQDDDVIVTKRQWGAFYGTDLELHLRRRGIRTLILTGIATHIGVESTARDAYERGFQQIFVEDATSSTVEEAHDATFSRIFPRIGLVRSTEQVLAGFG